MDNDSANAMSIDLGAIVACFVFLSVTYGSHQYQKCRKESWKSAYAQAIVALSRLALSFSVMYYVFYVCLSFISPEHAAVLSTHARTFTYSLSEYLVHGFYLLLIYLCYVNLESFKYISPSIFGSLSISMVYPLLYIVMASFLSSSTNWYVSSFMSMPESARFLSVAVLFALSTLVDYKTCTHLAHSESAVHPRLS